MQMVRVGPAPAGSTPFVKTVHGLKFDGQGGRQFDYGHSFDGKRGYRVFFKFRDSASANTWSPEDLLRWCAGVDPADDGQRDLLRIATQQARQCIALNKEWQRLGRPAGGVPDSGGRRLETAMDACDQIVALADAALPAEGPASDRAPRVVARPAGATGEAQR
ncbi:MAG: hypothetical protein AB7O88_28485 [Reyranellaceae bacterium]